MLIGQFPLPVTLTGTRRTWDLGDNPGITPEALYFLLDEAHERKVSTIIFGDHHIDVELTRLDREDFVRAQERLRNVLHDEKEIEQAARGAGIAYAAWLVSFEMACGTMAKRVLPLETALVRRPRLRALFLSGAAQQIRSLYGDPINDVRRYTLLKRLGEAVIDVLEANLNEEAKSMERRAHPVNRLSA